MSAAGVSLPHVQALELVGRAITAGYAQLRPLSNGTHGHVETGVDESVDALVGELAAAFNTQGLVLRALGDTVRVRSQHLLQRIPIYMYIQRQPFDFPWCESDEAAQFRLAREISAARSDCVERRGIVVVYM